MSDSQLSLEQTNPVKIAEYRLLNAVYLNPEFLLDSNVNRELFANSSTQAIFQSFVYLNSKNIPIERNAVFQYASGIDLQLQLSEVDLALGISSQAPASIQDIIEQLQNTKNSLEAIKFLRQAELEINRATIRTAESDDKIRALISRAETAYINLQSINRIKTYKDIYEDRKQILQDRKSGKRFRFNDPILDQAITYGPEPGHIGLICSASGSGKSAFCLNLLDRLEKINVPCFYYSLEMGETDTFDRKLALRKEIPLNDIVNPQDLETWTAIHKANEELFNELTKNQLFRFSESANVSIGQIKQDLKRFQADIGQRYLVCCIDLLSMVKNFTISEEGKNFAQVIEVAINELSALAKELQVHILAVLQLKRKEDKIIDDLKDLDQFRPTANGLKNSNSFIERCRYSIGLFRPRFYAEQFIEDESLYEEMEDICYLYSLKQNSGTVGRIKVGSYLFEPEIMKMTPILENNEEQSA